MRILLMIICLASISPIDTFARAGGGGGGDGFDNGGGLGEQNVTFAAMKFSWLLQPCWSGNLCRLDGEERRKLIEMMYSLDNSSFPEIEFASGTEQPDLFRRDGNEEIRMMNSQPSPLSKIFVNIDLLYTETVDGDLLPITVFSAIQHLLAETAHQKGIATAVTEIIIRKIANNLRWPAEEVFVRRYRKLSDVHLKAYRYSDDEDTFAIGDGNEIHDIDGFIRSQLMCMDFNPILAIRNVKMRNVRWLQTYRNSEDRDPVSKQFYIRLPLQTRIEYTCVYDGRVERWRGNLEIEVGLRFLEGHSGNIEMSDQPIKMQFFTEGTRSHLRSLQRY